MVDFPQLAAPLLLSDDSNSNDNSFALAEGASLAASEPLASTPSSSDASLLWSSGSVGDSSSSAAGSPAEASRQQQQQQQQQQQRRRCTELPVKEFTRLKYRQHVARLLQRTSERLSHADLQLRGIVRQMDVDKVRFERACARSQRSFRYTLRLRLAVLEGMCNMMRDYVAVKSSEKQKLISLLRHTESEIGLPACRFDDAS